MVCRSRMHAEGGPSQPHACGGRAVAAACSPLPARRARRPPRGGMHAEGAYRCMHAPLARRARAIEGAVAGGEAGGEAGGKAGGEVGDQVGEEGGEEGGGEVER